MRICDLAVDVRVEVEREPRKKETSDRVRVDVDCVEDQRVAKLFPQVSLTSLIMPFKHALE